MIPKNQQSYQSPKDIKREEIVEIIRNHIIKNGDLATAEETLLSTEGIRKVCDRLTYRRIQDFKRHLRRYLRIYLYDCPFDVDSIDRYNFKEEAYVTARRFIKRGEIIKYLSGI